MALIITDSPANIPHPAEGDVTPFYNSDENNRLCYLRSDGTFYHAESNAEDCCCEIMKFVTEGVICSLKSGMISMADFNTFIAAGMTVTGASTDDGEGNTTCTATIKNPA